MEPEALLQRYLAAGDEDAMAEFVRRTRPRLLRAARRICAADAEDSVQSAYLALVRKQGEPLGAPLLAWLLTAVIRISYRRRAQRSHERAIAERLAPGAGPLAGAITREEAELLRREVGRLPGTYRDPMILRYLQGLSHEETARLLDLNGSTLRTRLQRGRALLRARLSPRILYPVLALPWWLADHAAAAALGGVVMKSKLAAFAALLAILLLAGGAFHLATRDEERPPPRAPSVARESRGRPEAGPAAGGELPAAPGAPGDATDAFAAGTVVDEAGAPVPDVRVLVRRIRPDIAGRRLPEPLDGAMRTRAALAVTGAQGRFVVAREPKDASALVFFKERFVPVEVSCLAGGAAFDQTKGYVRFEGKSPGRDLRVVLSAGRALSGTVRDLSGVPLAGASVSVHARGFLTQRTTTDAQGRYEFTTLARNLTAASAVAGGYEFDRRREGEIGETADFRLRRMYLLVDLTDAVTGEPVGAARGIVVEAAGGRILTNLQPGGMAYTPPGAKRWAVPGRIYDASNLLPDRLRPGDPFRLKLYLFAPRYQPVVEEVELVKGEEPPHLFVKLTPGQGPPSIAGVVSGVRTARVELRYAYLLTPEGYPLLMSRDTDESGRFAFSGLPPGLHRLVVAAEGTGEIVREVEAPALDLVIELAGAASLEVVARDRAGRPVAGTAIHLEPIDGKRYWKQTTGQDGRARFEQVPPGKLRVAPVIVGFEQTLWQWDKIPHRELVLRPGERGRVEVSVPARIAFRLKLTDERGAPLAGLPLVSVRPYRGFVTVVGGDEWKRLREPGVRSNDAGELTIELYPGEYAATVARGATKHSRRIAVAEDSRRAGFVIPTSGAVIRGRVREMTTNKPLAGCRVRAFVTEGKPKRSAETTTGADGTFRLEGLPAAEIRLLVDPGTPAQRAGIGKRRHAPAFAKLVLEEDVDLDVVLPRLDGEGAARRVCELDVLVRDQGGPAKDVYLNVAARLGDGWARMGNGRTDAEGRQTFSVIAAPRYLLSVYARQGKRVERLVERDGDRMEVTVDLAPPR